MDGELKIVDLAATDLKSFKQHLADCVILDHQGRLFLQKRPPDWGAHANAINLFGGHVEAGESIVEALIREIEEETGARMNANDVIFVGALSEAFTGHTELVHIYFWHDKNGAMTGCYEALPLTVSDVSEAIALPGLMPYAKWALEECQRKNLLPA